MGRRTLPALLLIALAACGTGESALAPPSSTAPLTGEPVESLPPPTTVVTNTSTTIPIQQGRTITASPRTGLYGGRAVTAHGEGWPPDMEVGIAQCAPVRFPAEISECATFRSAFVKADASGRWDVRISVERTMSTSGRSIDCATSRCTLSASAVAGRVPVTRTVVTGAPDYLAVGEVALEFDPTIAPVTTLPPLQPQPVMFDLDGDTRPDQLWMEGSPGQSQLVARLATGAESRLRSFGDRAHVSVRNLNGIPLIFYGLTGNTASVALVATFAGGQLRTPVSNDPDHEEAAVGWSVHSMCCPEGTEDTACLVLDGRDVLVRTSSYLADRAGNRVDAATYRNDGDYQRHWTRRAIVLEGPRLVTVRNDSGVIARGAPAPPGVPLDNAFAC